MPNIKYELKTVWLDNTNQKEVIVFYEGTVQTVETTKQGILDVIKFKTLHGANDLKEFAIQQIGHSKIKFVGFSVKE